MNKSSSWDTRNEISMKVQRGHSPHGGQRSHQLELRQHGSHRLQVIKPCIGKMPSSLYHYAVQWSYQLSDQGNSGRSTPSHHETSETKHPGGAQTKRFEEGGGDKYTRAIYRPSRGRKEEDGCGLSMMGRMHMSRGGRRVVVSRHLRLLLEPLFLFDGDLLFVQLVVDTGILVLQVFRHQVLQVGFGLGL